MGFDHLYYVSTVYTIYYTQADTDDGLLLDAILQLQVVLG